MDYKQGRTEQWFIYSLLVVCLFIHNLVDAQCSTCTGTCNTCQGCGAGPNTTSPIFTCQDQTQLTQFLDYCDSICTTNPSACGLTLSSPCRDLAVFCYNFGASTVFLNTTTYQCALQQLGTTPVGSCNFAFLVTQCCNQQPSPPVVEPIAPPVIPPVAPPVNPPLAPLIPVVDCVNNTDIARVLQSCADECGPSCTVCGQVYTYCSDQGFLEGNFTIDYCLIFTLDGAPLVNGTCDFVGALDTCCGISPTPVSPPVLPPLAPVENCTLISDLTASLSVCSALCSFTNSCSSCDQVYSLCVGLGLLSPDLEYSACILERLANQSIVNGTCSFESALQSCCTSTPLPVPFSVTPSLEPIPVILDLPQDVACNTIFESDAALIQCLADCLENTGCGFDDCRQLYFYCVSNTFLTTPNITLSLCVEFESSLQVFPFCRLDVALGECCGTLGNGNQINDDRTMVHYYKNRLDDQSPNSSDNNGTSLFNISITIVGYNINMVNLIFIVFCFITALVILSCALKYGIKFAIKIMTGDETIKQRLREYSRYEEDVSDEQQREQGQSKQDGENVPFLYKKQL